jgi:hypothetical protein
MALAGVMAGFACGVKLTAVPMLLIAIPVGFTLAMLIRQQRGGLIPIALFLLGGLLVFSPWLIRNFIWTRNPVFPEAMSLFGRAHFSPEQAERWRLAYVPPPAQQSATGRLKAAWNQIFADWRYGFAIIPAGVFGFTRLWKKQRTKLQSLFLIVLLLMWLGFWLGFTHLQSRFFVLAVPVLAMLICQIETPLANLALTCGLLLQAGFGLLNLHERLRDSLGVRDGVDRSALIGLEHYQPVLEEKLKGALEGTGHLSLVGESRAFMFEMPMSRLHYRTIFDVDARGRDPVDAWFDGFPRKEGDTVLIDYEELRRFARTYHAIPLTKGEGRGRVIVEVGK